jgi:hypothetical protein
MVIGRGDGVDILIDHRAVSRQHCEILALEGGRFEVVDLGSANGLLINGQGLPRAILDASDVLILGDEVVLKYVPADDILRPGPYDWAPTRGAPPSVAAPTRLVPLVMCFGVLLTGAVGTVLWLLMRR